MPSTPCSISPDCSTIQTRTKSQRSGKLSLNHEQHSKSRVLHLASMSQLLELQPSFRYRPSRCHHPLHLRLLVICRVERASKRRRTASHSNSWLKVRPQGVQRRFDQLRRAQLQHANRATGQLGHRSGRPSALHVELHPVPMQEAVRVLQVIQGQDRHSQQASPSQEE